MHSHLKGVEAVPYRSNHDVCLEILPISIEIAGDDHHSFEVCFPD